LGEHPKLFFLKVESGKNDDGKLLEMEGDKATGKKINAIYICNNSLLLILQSMIRELPVAN